MIFSSLIDLLNSATEWWKGALIIYTAFLILAGVVVAVLRVENSIFRYALLTIPCISLFLLTALSWMYISFDTGYYLGKLFPSPPGLYGINLDFIGRYNYLFLVAALLIAIYIKVKKGK